MQFWIKLAISACASLGVNLWLKKAFPDHPDFIYEVASFYTFVILFLVVLQPVYILPGKRLGDVFNKYPIPLGSVLGLVIGFAIFGYPLVIATYFMRPESANFN